MFEIKVYQAEEVKLFIDIVSNLRVNTFLDYPYLYEGTLEAEKKYMESYANDPRALFAVAFKGDEVVGVSTGIPVDSQSVIVQDLKKKLALNGFDVKNYYYYGEVIILPEYRGNGLATQLIQDKEHVIKKWGYTHACLLTVKRDIDDPRKPKNYLSSDVIWKHLGFSKIPECSTNFNWNTILINGSRRDMENTMEFWHKKYTI